MPSRELRVLQAWTVAGLALVALSVAPPASAQDLERGRTLFALCGQCHGAAGEGQRLALAPAIAGMESWYVEGQLQKFRSGLRAAHFDDIAGMRMRGMARWLKTDDDVKAVSAFVASLPRRKTKSTVSSEGNAARGAAIYVTCAACHGQKAEGVPAVQGPALHTDDWYLMTQLLNYQRGIRGNNPLDTNGVVMRGMTAMLADEQTIKDVLAHIRTLDAPAGASSE